MSKDMQDEVATTQISIQENYDWSFVFVSIPQTDKYYEGGELQNCLNSISIVFNSPMEL